MEQAFRARTQSRHAEHAKARPTVPREPQHRVPVRLWLWEAAACALQSFFWLGGWGSSTLPP